MLLSIIIVEYKSLNDIKKCISSIQKKIAVINKEIIISSNSEYAKVEQEKITKLYPHCKWVFNSKNGGFAYAMNRGLKAAKGDYLIIMNPDCVINYGIEDMLNFLKANPSIGAIAPQIIDFDGNIQDTCRPYVSFNSFIYRQIVRIIFNREVILNKKTDYNLTQTTDWIIGAFIMLTRKAYELTNGLSEEYFMYAEDLDLCTRIRKSGLEIVYYPKAQITYRGSRSARRCFKYARIFIKSHFIYWNKFGFFCGYPKRNKIIYGK